MREPEDEGREEEGGAQGGGREEEERQGGGAEEELFCYGAGDEVAVGGEVAPEGCEATEADPGVPIAFDDAGFEEGAEEEDGGEEEGFERGEEASWVVAHEV